MRESETLHAHARAVSDASFATEVLGAPGLVMVDFTASWCPPCRILAPIVEQLAADHAGRLSVAMLDMDANPATVAACRVSAAPTLLYFRAGEVVGRIVGAVPRGRIEALLAELGEEA
jgi:thioredoxin 1